MRGHVASVRDHAADKLRTRLYALTQTIVTSGWELAALITDIVQKELYRRWGFASVRAWTLEDLAGHYTPSAVSRIVHTICKLNRMSAEQRATFEARPFWNVVEALELDVEEAEALVKSGKSALDIRYAAKARKLRAATEAGEPPPPPDDKFVDLDLPRVPEAIRELFQRVSNLVRFRLERDTPSMVAILEYLLVEYEQSWQAEVAPEFLHHTTSDGRELEWTVDEVARGAIRCKMCGSWDRTKLTPHHVVPRSHYRKQCDVEGGHEVPIVLLCVPCHRAVTENEDGTWRSHAELWGFGDLAEQH